MCVFVVKAFPESLFSDGPVDRAVYNFSVAVGTYFVAFSQTSTLSDRFCSILPQTIKNGHDALAPHGVLHQPLVVEANVAFAVN